MPSDVEICNRALTKIGDERILALTDDSKAARLMNSMFTATRDAELRRNRWNFAMKRASLAALATSPEWGYTYQYPLPSDFLHLVQVGEIYCRSYTRSKGVWQVETGPDGQLCILTDLSAPLRIRYVYRATNAGHFDPLFVEALACKLAMEGVETLTQSGSKKQMLADEYIAALKEAQRSDAIENPPEDLPRGSWLDSREGGGGSFTGSDGGMTGYVPGLPSDSVYADYYADGYA